MLVATATLLFLVAGCGALQGIHVFPVSIVNDTGDAVVLRDCNGYCSSSPIAIHLRPGESAVIHRVPHDHKTFSITTLSGSHVGCLDLYFATPQPGAQVPVSRATPCRATSGAPWTKIGLALLAIGLVLTIAFAVLRRA